MFSDLSEKMSTMYNKAKSKVMDMSKPTPVQESPMQGGSRKRRRSKSRRSKSKSMRTKRKSMRTKRKSMRSKSMRTKRESMRTKRKRKHVRFSKKNKIYTFSK